MAALVCDPTLAQATLIAIRRESWYYLMRKPGRVPPADSPNRPALARLWSTAYSISLYRRKMRTFTYGGKKFGVVYIDDTLCVMDWATRSVLVRAPSSLPALADMLGWHGH